MIPKRIKKWCERNGWSEPFLSEGKYYAFAPNAAIPELVPLGFNNWKLIDVLSLWTVIFLILTVLYVYLSAGMWSIYISQIGEQKFLACRYCLYGSANLVELKDKSKGLQEIQAAVFSKPVKLLVKNYSNPGKKVRWISQSEVKGQVLYLFPTRAADKQ